MASLLPTGIGAANWNLARMKQLDEGIRRHPGVGLSREPRCGSGGRDVGDSPSLVAGKVVPALDQPAPSGAFSGTAYEQRACETLGVANAKSTKSTKSKGGCHGRATFGTA